MKIVQELEQTCSACPAQWEGTTRDGERVYVRYRWGWLQVGFGKTLDDAIDDDTISKQIGDSYDGVMDYGQLKEAVPEVSWP